MIDIVLLIGRPITLSSGLCMHTDIIYGDSDSKKLILFEKHSCMKAYARLYIPNYIVIAI